MEVFTDAEIIALREFRSRIRDVVKDDYYGKDENLIRWLRARDLDLDKAEQMYRSSLKWREENKIDKMMETEVDPDLKAQFPFYCDGIDKEGCVVLSLAMGRWDMRKCVEEKGQEVFTQYLVRLLETGLRKVKEIHEKNPSNKPRRVCYTILSCMDGFSFRQLANMKTVHSILQAVSTLEAHYPETMKTDLIINAPTVFSVLFSLIKPLLTARTLSKVKIFSANKAVWEPEVFAMISPSEIRQPFGGTKF